MFQVVHVIAQSAKPHAVSGSQTMKFWICPHAYYGPLKIFRWATFCLLPMFSPVFRGSNESKVPETPETPDNRSRIWKSRERLVYWNNFVPTAHRAKISESSSWTRHQTLQMDISGFMGVNQQNTAGWIEPAANSRRKSVIYDFNPQRPEIMINHQRYGRFLSKGQINRWHCKAVK